MREWHAYRLSIEVDPKVGGRRVSVSRGEKTIWNTLRNGEPSESRIDHPLDSGTLRWEIVAEPSAVVRLSVNAIRIENHPMF